MSLSYKKIAVIGGDKRLFYLAEELRNDGFSVTVFGNEGGMASIDGALENAEAVVLPFPVSPDGVYLNAHNDDIRLSLLFKKIKEYGIKQVFGGSVSQVVIKIAEKYGISICDYGKIEAVALKNALCTAEGALQIALEKLPVTIHSSKVTVIGYGRIGKILSKELFALGANVSAVARKREVIAEMQIDGITPFYFNELKTAVKDSVLIFNTVPVTVMDYDVLSSLSNRPLIIDLASAPGGIDRDSAATLGINVIWALSLPGKTSPKTAALIIKEAVIDSLSEKK